MNFVRFTPANHSGDVFVRSDAVLSVTEIDYANAFLTAPPCGPAKATVIGTIGYGSVYVKESPREVIDTLAQQNHRYTVTVECEDDDTSSLSDDCDCVCGLTCEDDEEGDENTYEQLVADAKIAEERAEWYKNLFEKLNAELEALAAKNKKLQDELRWTKQLAQDAKGRAFYDNDYRITSFRNGNWVKPSI